MKMLNVKIDDWTHKNLKALAALKEMSVSSVLKFLVGKEITDNPDECALCLRYGREPNEETRKVLEASARGKGLTEIISGEEALRQYDEEFGEK